MHMHLWVESCGINSINCSCWILFLYAVAGVRGRGDALWLSLFGGGATGPRDWAVGLE